jgi:hypothetical protein
VTRNKEEWWDVFRRASGLRDRLKEVESTLSYEEKRAAKQAIKREAFELLNESDIPQPLRMLIVDLWGGPATVVDRYPWPPEKMAAAYIEASQAKPIRYKRLTTLLREHTGKSIDPARVKNWRRDPEYQYFVKVRREPKGD